MEWTIKMHWHERKTFDGVVSTERDEEYTIPFDSLETIYYAHKKKFWKKRSPWVITKTEVVRVWASNTYGVMLKSGDCIDCVNFKYLFTNRDEAIEFCLKKNQHNKIKIYGEY